MMRNLILPILLFASSSLYGQEVVDISPLSIADSVRAEGVAVADFNNDGLSDFYLSNPEGRNWLFQNMGEGLFTEVSERYGLDVDSRTKTSVWGDFNNDGFRDLYLGNQDGTDQLFLNVDGEAFEEVTISSGIYNPKQTQSVNLADVDNDGFLDIYVSNFLSENILYRNNGDLTFSNYIYLSGAVDVGKSMGSLFFDYDGDGDSDLYLVHDDFEKNFLYLNNGQGRFEEIAESVGADVQSYGMGPEILDVNLDGHLDLYITNLFSNTLLVNDGSGNFQDQAGDLGIDDFGMSWGVTKWDYQNDGFEDIYIANEYEFSPYESMLYRKFIDSFSILQTANPLINQENNFGLATIDLDSDGDLDLLSANKSSYMRIYRNDEEQGHFLRIKLIGSESNRDAVGAKIKWIKSENEVHLKTVQGASGWTSQSSSVLHFGLGEFDQEFKATIYWPSGLQQELSLSDLNKFYTITEGGEALVGNIFPNHDSSSATEDIMKQVIQIYPNPQNGAFVVENLSDNPILELTIFDHLGRRLDSQITYHGHKAFVSDVSNGDFGMLFCQIKTRNKLIVRKILCSQ